MFPNFIAFSFAGLFFVCLFSLQNYSFFTSLYFNYILLCFLRTEPSLFNVLVLKNSMTLFIQAQIHLNIQIILGTGIVPHKLKSLFTVLDGYYDRSLFFMAPLIKVAEKNAVQN